MTAVTLVTDDVRVEIVPGEGGRVQHLVDLSSGRELLYQRTPPPGRRTDFLSGCPGGWDDLFPNDTPWNEHPDHGCLWSTPFQVLAHTRDEVTLDTRLEHPAVDVRRRYLLLPLPRHGLRIETTLRAVQDTGPFLWASHPMLAVGEGWRIDLPPATMVPDAEMRGRFASVTPLDGGDRERALVLPPPAQGWSEVLYVSGVAQASVRSSDGAYSTRLTWDAGFLRHLWLVTVSGEMDLDLCFLFEPCTSRPYRLDDAIAAGEAASLPTGAERTWWTELESMDREVDR